jgi:hypothetical protein
MSADLPTASGQDIACCLKSRFGASNPDVAAAPRVSALLLGDHAGIRVGLVFEARRGSPLQIQVSHCVKPRPICRAIIRMIP